MDTVTVIDLEANPPRVMDKVVVGDSPEGFAINPTGRLEVALRLDGNEGPTNEGFSHRNGKVSVPMPHSPSARSSQEDLTPEDPH